VILQRSLAASTHAKAMPIGNGYAFSSASSQNRVQKDTGKVMDGRSGLVIDGWVSLDPADTGVIEKLFKKDIREGEPLTGII
jgi:hypothetical protein